MYSRLHCLIACLISGAVALTAATAGAQTPPVLSSPAAPAATGILHGHVLDPTGALIPGAQVTVTAATGAAVRTATADAAGAYAVRGLAAGSYVVQVTSTGFAPFVSMPIPLAAGQTKNVDVKMAIETTEQKVVVTEEGGPTVSTEASANSNAMVLKGSDLDALSDDPDELSNELQALAGPSAGPNGGQIYIDGFTGGQLPPKSAIREIRINRNPFSAEFDKVGYGRIEILTKPGSDTLHGRFFGQGNDNAFNTGNPFTAELPSYYSDQFNGTVSGPISHAASYFFSIEDRETQSDDVYSIPGGPTYNAASNTWCVYPASGLCPATVAGSLFSPANHLEVSPRVDLQLGQKNTLTLRYQFYRNNIVNSLAHSTWLPSLAMSSDTIEHTAQFDDTQIINDRMVNETRFEYRRANITSSPIGAAPGFGVTASTAPSFDVQGVFSGGGNESQLTTAHDDHYELQNYTTLTKGTQTIKFGTWMRDNREAQSTNGNFNGTFTFPSAAAFIATWNGIQQGQTIAQIAAQCPATQTGGCVPTQLTYTTGPIAFQANVFNGALFAEDDWTVNKNLTLSGGLRWETQNHIADHSDWGPRVAFAYALDGHGKGQISKTVLRGGFGFFYDRFTTADLMNLEMLSGAADSQVQNVIPNPQCFNATSLGAIGGGVAACVPTGSTARAATPVIYSIAPHYRSPYMEQAGVSLERQLTKASTLSFTYMRSSGFHQLVVRDSNAYLPGDYIYNTSGAPTILAPRPNPNLGIVDQYFPEAIFNENQIIVNFNARFSPNLGLFGFYTASWANSDGGGGSNPSNSYNLMQDYGRAGFIHPQWLFLMGNYTGPKAITFNPFIIVQQGAPYNITSPYDLTGDNFFNNRPSYANSTTIANHPGNVVQTDFGALNVVPDSGENLLPAYIGNGPAGIAFNLRVGRSFGIGPKEQSSGPPPGGGPGGHHGHFGSPFGGGSFGHGPGMDNTGHKYSLNFNVQALNLLNDINLGAPHGGIQPTLTSCTNPNAPGTCTYGPGPEFGRSTSLAGRIFSTSSASRRIYFQMAFQF